MDIQTTKGLLVWMLDGDTGVSSETIVRIAIGVKPPRGDYYDAPYDPSDFGRCYRLLKKFPELNKKLPLVARKCKAFSPLISHWNELTALWEEESNNGTGRAPRLYARMKKLRGCE